MADEHVMLFHAAKTKHENFEESSEAIQPLTEEEKKVEAAKLKERIKVRSDNGSIRIDSWRLGIKQNRLIYLAFLIINFTV